MEQILLLEPKTELRFKGEHRLRIHISVNTLYLPQGIGISKWLI